MGRRLRREEVMTIEVLHERGLSNRAIARQLGVHEHAVRYRLARQAAPAPDGRAGKPFAPALLTAVVGIGHGERAAGGAGALLHNHLVLSNPERPRSTRDIANNLSRPRRGYFEQSFSGGVRLCVRHGCRSDCPLVRVQKPAERRGGGG